MSSVFQPFTTEEVESIKSVVMVGQQSDDMLLSNCTRRPLAETRAFIRRFKKNLVDQHTTSEELATMGNQQYVAIITAARAKKTGHQSMSSARSMMNLSLPFKNPSDSLPLKFITKFSRVDNENEAQQPRPSLPTRSRSVSNGLSQELQDAAISQVQPNRTNIQIIPPINFNFPQGCKSADEIMPGDLAAVMRSLQGPPIIGRVLALKAINGIPHALVAFFLEGVPPSYLPLNHLVMLKREADSQTIKPNDNLTVDIVLKKIMEQAQSNVLINDDIQDIESDDKLRRCIVFQAIACASQLQLLAFVSSWEIPEDKMMIMSREVNKMSRPKFASTGLINQRCSELILKILKYL